MNKTNHRKIDRTGEEGYNNFGSKIIIEKYESARDIDVYFPEYNWTCYHTKYLDFKRGSIACPYEPKTLGIGYIGEGLYKSKENKVETKQYRAWYHMLRRCYDTKYKEKHLTYENCSVCEEWLNFQNFAKWFDDNYYEILEEEMNLDKDILVKGNKEYGPNTCVFVPEKINILFIKHDTKRGQCPIGVTRSGNKYQVKCNLNKEPKYLGRYDTKEEAFLVYKTFKESAIKQMADQYRDLIPEKLYSAMYEYEVDIND